MLLFESVSRNAGGFHLRTISAYAGSRQLVGKLCTMEFHPFTGSSQNPAAIGVLGRISPEKGVDRAVEIARRTGLRLRIAAKVDRADHEYLAESSTASQSVGRVYWENK